MEPWVDRESRVRITLQYKRRFNEGFSVFLIRYPGQANSFGLRPQKSEINTGVKNTNHSKECDIFIDIIKRRQTMNVTVAIPMCLKIRYKDYISQTHLIYFSCWVYMGDMFRPCLGHHQALNLRIQVLHKLAHKMQVGIPVAYNVCEVKLDKINHWICVHRQDFQLRWYIKIQVKSRIYSRFVQCFCTPGN